MKIRFMNQILVGVMLIISLFLIGCSDEGENEIQEAQENLENAQDNNDSGKMEEKITLKFAQVIPENHPWFEFGDKIFMEKVSELSDGMIDIEYYPDAQLGG